MPGYLGDDDDAALSPFEDAEARFKQEQARRDKARRALEDVQRAAQDASKAFKEEFLKMTADEREQAVERMMELLRRQAEEKQRVLERNVSRPIITKRPVLPMPVDQEDYDVRKVSPPCVIQFGKGQRGIKCIGDKDGKPFIALITGRDATFGWARKWVGQRTSRTVSLAPGEIELIVGIETLGPLPAALDIRWGPRGGGGGLCLYRGLFKVIGRDPWLMASNDQEVAKIIANRDDNLPEQAGPTPGRRAPISFDEEVL